MGHTQSRRIENDMTVLFVAKAVELMQLVQVEKARSVGAHTNTNVRSVNSDVGAG